MSPTIGVGGSAKVTSQTKQFIEMGDILSLRCDCKECGASLSLPIGFGLAKSLLSCPKCRKPWLQFEGGTYQITVDDFAKRVEELKQLLPTIGCKLYVEIAPEADS